VVLCRIGRSARRRIFALDGDARSALALRRPQERFERAFDEAMSNGGGLGWEIISGGQFGGRWPLAGARGRWLLLV